MGEQDFAAMAHFGGFVFVGKLGEIFQTAIRSDLDSAQPRGFLPGQNQCAKNKGLVSGAPHEGRK